MGCCNECAPTVQPQPTHPRKFKYKRATDNRTWLPAWRFAVLPAGHRRCQLPHHGRRKTIRDCQQPVGVHVRRAPSSPSWQGPQQGRDARTGKQGRQGVVKISIWCPIAGSPQREPRWLAFLPSGPRDAHVSRGCARECRVRSRRCRQSSTIHAVDDSQ